MALITCNNAAFAYDGVTVAEHISFSVHEGEYLCVVGENGSGKSTLIKGILGLISPSEGEIILGDGLTRRDIGYLPQQTPAQRDFPASVGEVVLSGCLSSLGRRAFYTAAQKKTARESMALLGIDGLSGRCFRELSGGQRQRALLARALCAAHRLLVLDEPTAGLDPAAAKDMYGAVSMLSRERGMAIIMISHDIAAAAKDAGQILHLNKTPLFYGSAEDYLKSDAGRRFAGGGGYG